MIRHLFTLIWNQRRQNGWIYAELLLVLIGMWMIADNFVVQFYSYSRPLGYQIDRCWRLAFDHYSPDAPEYVADTARWVSDGEGVYRILDRLRRTPEVEEACVAFWSSPYSPGNSWASLMPCDGDTAVFRNRTFHRYQVSKEYYTVFRVQGLNGEDLSQLPTGEGFIITSEMAQDFWQETSVIGKEVCGGPSDTEWIKVLAVTHPIRENDFVKPTPAFFYTAGEKQCIQYINAVSASSAEVSFRLKKDMTQEEMNAFLTQLGDQLTEGNLYVSSAESWSNYRDSRLKDNWQMLGIRVLMALFILLNVFFGVTGTFWLRIQQRRAETGLRMALGSSRTQVGWLLTAEGWLLLTGVLPLVVLFILNVWYMELPDLNNLPFTWWRLLIGLGGSFLLMSLMIALGTWLPARRAMQLEPAEALHYE